MIALLWAKVWKWVCALGAILAAIASIWLWGREKGKASEQIKTRAAQDAAATAQATAQQLESRYETDVAVERLPDAPAGAQLGDAPRDTSAGKLSDWAD